MDEVLWIPSSPGKYSVDETLNELGSYPNGSGVAYSM